MTSFVYILAFYFAGEFLSEFFRLPFPGSITGFFLALLVIALMPATEKKLKGGSEFFLGLLPLFLVPVAVSIFFLFITSEKNLYFFAGIILISLFLGVLVTALVMKYLMGLFSSDQKKSVE